MSSVGWYWHRLKAMTPAELAGHGRRKLHQFTDNLRSANRFAQVQDLPEGIAFPHLPKAAAAPELLKAALQRDATAILQGRWMAFGHLELQVDDPPRWQYDYLAGVDLTTEQPALKLHHRVEGKADIKLIWEPSRWYSLVRLAQAAYVLGNPAAGARCLKCLEDWIDKNPPYIGWHWTSGLESGLRLIQFAWIDALLTNTPTVSNAGARLARIRARLLPAHLWFTWRNRSFGSSANNHIIGELAGLLIVLVRWPSLERWAAPLDRIQELWEREVLTQFAPDGGNREQALNYHLFSWEFCWQARLALKAAGRTVPSEVDDRLRAAVGYFLAIQAPQEPWDYGDSDSAFVTPFFAQWNRATTEWSSWLQRPAASPALEYWLGAAPKAIDAPAVRTAAKGWRLYPETGYGVCRSGDWFLRFDLSPLGYLSTAGHGHCDALHLSLWHKGHAVLIDPGTGAYHADRPLRDYLASWAAHNGPHPVGLNFPERRGAFLWSAHHERPRWEQLSETSLRGELQLPSGVMRRTITRLEARDGWQIEDSFDSAASREPNELEVLWQLAPAVRLETLSPVEFRLHTSGAPLTLRVEGWSRLESGPQASSSPLRGICSPAFRATVRAPFVLLRGSTPPLKSTIAVAS